MALTRTLETLLRHHWLARQSEQTLLGCSDRKLVAKVLAKAVEEALQRVGAGAEGNVEAEAHLECLASLLSQVADKRAIKSLFLILGGTSPSARDAAAAALVDVAEERFDLFRATARAALSPPSESRGPGVEELASVLAEVEHPDAADMLLALLRDPEPRVIASAVEAAFEHGWNEDVRAGLSELLDDQRQVVVEDDEEGQVRITISELARDALEAIGAVMQVRQG